MIVMTIDWIMVAQQIEVAVGSGSSSLLVFVKKAPEGWCVLDGSPLSKFKGGRAAGGLEGWMRAFVGLWPF